MRRVIGRWYEEEVINNGNFKNYSSKEIPQSDVFTNDTFKKNKGVYDILKNWYRKKLKRLK